VPTIACVIMKYAGLKLSQFIACDHKSLQSLPPFFGDSSHIIGKVSNDQVALIRPTYQMAPFCENFVYSSILGLLSAGA